MMITERIQAAIHALEFRGARWLNYAALTLMVLALALWYDTHCYHNFSAPEAMDAAQVARNLAEGKGFTTEFIRPFSICLLQKHNHAMLAAQVSGTNAVDAAEVYGRHPDLANAPLYPVALAGLFKMTRPEWEVDLRSTFWSDSGNFVRYKPEFQIAIFNQILLLAAVLLTFMVARIILDMPAAWLSAILVLFSDELWKFSVSGLPTLLLLVIFLGLVWCLVSLEDRGDVDNPAGRRRFMFAALAGLLIGLGMLTQYSFGWLIVPVALYLALFGGQRRALMAAAAFLVFAAVVLPWIMRNLAVSGAPLGTAGYALMEDSEAFPGSRLSQSLNPETSLFNLVHLTMVKWINGIPDLLRVNVTQLGGGWAGVLFLAGLLLGLRNAVARRLRYFTLMCLGLMLVITPLGRTQWTEISPDMTGENLLVLLLPMAVIFGVAFFLTMLNQMNIAYAPMRYVVVALVVVLVRLQFAITLLPPKARISAYPPYYPPDIQKFSVWIQPNELVMSDVPWAVAWYGDRQCVWTTLNCGYEFVALNDFIKPVNALYLTLYTLDGRFITDCVQGSVNNWSNFGFKAHAYNHLPNKFPLSQFPLESLSSGLFLTDHQRWQTQ